MKEELKRGGGDGGVGVGSSSLLTDSRVQINFKILEIRNIAELTK